MITGSRFVTKSPVEVMDRLKLAMAAGNFEMVEVTEDSITFRHGTWLTQSAPQFPKAGKILLDDKGEGTDILYAVEPVGFPKYWLILCGIVFFWLIFPPILAHRTLVHHPRRVMENLLQGI